MVKKMTAKRWNKAQLKARVRTVADCLKEAKNNGETFTSLTRVAERCGISKRSFYGRYRYAALRSQAEALIVPVEIREKMDVRTALEETIQRFEDEGNPPGSLSALATAAGVGRKRLSEPRMAELRIRAIALILTGNSITLRRRQAYVRDMLGIQRPADRLSGESSVRVAAKTFRGDPLDTRDGGIDAYPYVHAKQAIKMV